MKRNRLFYTFIIILIGFSIFDILEPVRNFSELENRKLKTRVEFDINELLDESFKDDYEKYINDQIAFRDTFINIKSISESALGKVENNNIIYGKDGYLFEKYSSVDKHRQNVNINSINKFIENTDANVHVMIAPNSYGIYKEKLPIYAPIVDMEEEITSIYNEIKGANKINLLDIMKDNKEQYIYYKTDHHWTTYGAYLAYKEFMHSLYKKPVNISQLKEKKVDNFYGTYFNKSKRFNTRGDTISYYEFSNIEMKIGDKTYTNLYDYSKFKSRDKYSAFLYDNNPLTIIKNKDLKNGEKLLVIKDSFANSLIPFLTQNFEEIHVIDLRAFSDSVSKYIENNKIKDTLILYNFINFNKDSNIIKIKY